MLVKPSLHWRGRQAPVLLTSSALKKLQIHHFFQFLTHKPLLFFPFQVVDVQVVVVPCAIEVASAQQHAAARRDEEKMHSAAASTCRPAAKLRSGQLHWCLEAQKEGNWSYYFVHNTSELQWWAGNGTLKQ